MIDSRNRRLIARIDFDDARLLVDDLRLVIAHLVDLAWKLDEAKNVDDLMKSLIMTKHE